jgi:hypothetical protein
MHRKLDDHNLEATALFYCPFSHNVRSHWDCFSSVLSDTANGQICVSEVTEFLSTTQICVGNYFSFPNIYVCHGTKNSKLLNASLPYNKHGHTHMENTNF